jgi:membrane protein YdbS with pleckstrin-like domain
MKIQKGVTMKNKFKKKLKLIIKICMILIISIYLLFPAIMGILFIFVSIYKDIPGFMVGGILAILITPYIIDKGLKDL